MIWIYYLTFISFGWLRRCRGRQAGWLLRDASMLRSNDPPAYDSRRGKVSSLPRGMYLITLSSLALHLT